MKPLDGPLSFISNRSLRAVILAYALIQADSSEPAEIPESEALGPHL